ncbi:MAG: hypothetical protein M1818_005868 [Claussenomyces sp. TS43310]|nr:MAG: hypothetical protein M1818_005868 [Claussenomyces sp. TS43310]
MASTPTPKPEKSYLSAAVESISPWSTPRSSSPKQVASGSVPGPASRQQQGGDHSLSHRHGLSARRYPKDCPPLNARWFYAVDIPKRKPKLLRETPAESKPLAPPKKFVTFGVHDSRSIEVAYQKLVEDDEANGALRRPEDEGSDASAMAGNKENTSITEAGENENGGGRIKVPVNEDFLFDVDIEQRELAPVYWLGPIYEVRRGSWFYQEGSGLRPCEENLAMQLEEGYLKVKPFRYPKVSEKKTSSRPASMKYDDPKSLAVPSIHEGTGSREPTPKSSIENLKSINQKAVDAAESGTKDAPPPAPHQPQTHRLFGTYMNSVVTYQDDTVAWLSSDGIMSRVSSTMYQRFAGGGYFGGVKIVRGYTDSGAKPTETKPEGSTLPVSGLPEKSNNPGLQLDERQQKILKRRSAPTASSTAGSSDAENADSGPAEPESRDAALKRQISSMVIDSMDPEAGEEAVRRRDEKEIQDDYQDHDGEDQSREIDHLILVTHGIGQRLGMRTESVNFVHDVNVLRKNLKSVYSNSADLQALNSEIDKLPKNCRVQVLPVCWRHLLDFPRQGRQQNRKEHDLGDAFGEDDEYPRLEDITLEGVPFVRSLITDLALDILLYQSGYREHISSIVLHECNRIYKLFLERNPSFNGKVSLIGHSLGSAILFDILCRQKEEAEVHGSGQHQRPYQSRSASNSQRHGKPSKEFSFDFAVEDFYCLGSPVGLFQMLKGRTIAARHQANALPTESPMETDFLDGPFFAGSHPTSKYSAGERISPVTGLPFTISSPKCAQLYNIFHPSDPISYRLEPLIAPAMASLKPQALPYTKKGIFGSSASQGLTGIGSRVGQSVSGLWSSLSSGIASSLLNRSLGLTGEDVASMGGTGAQQSSSNRIGPSSAAAGTNISAGGVISPEAHPPPLIRENTSEKKLQLAENTAAADRDGHPASAPTLIDDDIETLYAGFQKQRKGPSDEDNVHDQKWAEAEEKSSKLRREELKVRSLNQNGRVDFSIQESVLDFNPINTIASHLSYWADEDVSHFVMSQLLSRHRMFKRTGSTDRSPGTNKF